jgi:hypothetical protein
VGVLMSSVGLIRWGGRPGSGLLLLALLASLAFLIRDVRAVCSGLPREGEQAG